MRRPSFIGNLTLLAVAASSLVVLAALTDRLVIARYANVDADALLFPPGTTMLYRTPEFSYRATINSRGFRDREFGERKPGTGRIVVLGDSFTYGWGVDGAQAFPKVLEDELRLRGHDQEVANLGVPGGSPPNYVAVAGKAVSALQPDLVIVAVLQGDDLAQMTLAAEAPRPGLLAQARSIAYALMFRLTPHLRTILDRRAGERPLSVVWRGQSRNLLASFTAEQKARYEALDAGVRTRFVEGQLNPRMIQLSVTRPGYFLETLAVEAEPMQLRVDELSDALRSVARTAADHQASLLVVGVPYRAFASDRDNRNEAALGFEVSAEMVRSSAPDDAIRAACERARVPFLSVTVDFRALAREQALYYEFDGHFNPRGHAAFAQLLANRLTEGGFLD